MEFENLLYEAENGRATVTINRPDKANALDAQTMLDIMAVFSQIKIDPDIRGAILTGAGEKFFVAGADITELKNLNAESGANFSTHGHAIFSLIEELGTPEISAVNWVSPGCGRS